MNRSIEEQNEILKKDTRTYLNSLIYFAESEEKNNLGNVNEKWKEADYVITNTSITVGVNYEGLDFDKIYLFISGTTGNPRDIIQTSMRIRKTKEDIVELFFFDTTTKNFIKYPKYYYETNDTIYKNLINDVYSEYHCDFIDSFKKLCDLTNYNYKKVAVLQNREAVKKQKYINDIYESGMLIEYSKIPNIDEEQKEIIENKMYERKATLIERLTIDKYYFDNTFEHLNKQSRQLLWNHKGRNFIKNIEDDIINNVNKDNNIDTINKLNFEKLIISDNTLDIINTRFSSTMNSKIKNKLVIKAINNVLGIVAIDNKRSDSGRARGYKFTDLFNTLYTVYDEHIESIKKKKEQSKTSEFIEDINDYIYISDDDIDAEYNQFIELKKNNKPIPSDLKKFDLDL